VRLEDKGRRVQSIGVIGAEMELTGRGGAMATTLEVGGSLGGPRTNEARLEWRKMLEGFLRERRRVLLGRPVASEGCPDPMDEAREREEEAVWLAILHRSREMQATAEEALNRLATGEYGQCVECEQPIALARLRALPFAVRCLSCQERVEQERELTIRRSASRGGVGSSGKPSSIPILG
jgi:RNA polymerase-binding protein DksA